MKRSETSKAIQGAGSMNSQVTEPEEDNSPGAELLISRNNCNIESMTEAEKLAQRAQRFRGYLGTNTEAAAKAAEEEKLKLERRALRFGIGVGNKSGTLPPISSMIIDEEERYRRQQRALRFGISTAELESNKLTARAQRFGLESSTSGSNSSVGLDGITAKLEARKLRFQVEKKSKPRYFNN